VLGGKKRGPPAGKQLALKRRPFPKEKKKPGKTKKKAGERPGGLTKGNKH